MSEGSAVSGGIGPGKADNPRYIQPSIRNALPHYLPLGIFPLLILAATHGGWWLLPPFLFMSVSGPLDKVLGLDGRNMDPAKTPERRLLWHNVPVWTWALLWPPTLIFGMWQILVANQFAIWEGVVLVILLTMEAQAVFVVGHEMIHRRTTWERRIGEFLLASASYPQYATEHLYIHHAKVGTPHDVGSAPKGESFWRYFPREVASNLTNSWKSAAERLARRRLPVWHYSNPFWRYVIFVAFWYALVFWMSGVWAVLVFAFLGLCCVFSMKISNYFQHYGLRRVRLPNGRWEKVMPRHSWSADWKFSNWMFFNMQRHADHHAMASRHYPLLQVGPSDESPELPGTYADMMNIVLRPKRWFAKMDPLVDQWREHFYPEIDDWSAYDSPLTAARPDAFEAIVEIFGAAPRLARWIERNSELLDNLQDREFTDLDLPKGFGLDEESESIARRGLARLYWTHEMGVQEMKDQIAELPTADAKESAEIVRNWSNDKAFQIGMHVLRGNLSPGEAKTALSNLADATISTVLAAVVADFVDRVGPLRAGGVAAICLGDLASREVYPGVGVDMLFVHDGWQFGENERLCRRFRETLTDLAQDSLLFAPIPSNAEFLLALPLSELVESSRNPPSSQVPVLARARCVFECGDSEIGNRFQESWREVIAQWRADERLIAQLREPPAEPAETDVFSYAHMRGGLEDVERAARLLQLTDTDAREGDPAPTAAAVFQAADTEPLAEAAALWRDLQGITCLIGDGPAALTTAGQQVKSLVANACGHEDFGALESSVAETASRAAARIDALVARA
ncbi:MAG: hypothetical protein F4X98_10635 [Gammaproteobacteria bacterium]|nr:hypothetical protein [Gammaproteobacteria bacterium]